MLASVAKGGLTLAHASVTLSGIGWDQNVSAAGTVSQSVTTTNTGSFIVNGSATANGAKRALAAVAGNNDEFEQSATGVGTSVAQSVINNARDQAEHMPRWPPAAPGRLRPGAVQSGSSRTLQYFDPPAGTASA